MKGQGGSVQRDSVIATLGTPKVIATLGTSTGLPHGPMLFRLSRARPARAPRGNPCRELPRPPVRTYPALSALPGILIRAALDLCVPASTRAKWHIEHAPVTHMCLSAAPESETRSRS